MKIPKNIRGRASSTWRLGALAAVLSAVVLVGVAQAAPSTKNYDAAVTPASADGLTFTLTLKNDRSSQQTLGSANFTAPDGLRLNNDATTTAAGWHACVGDGMTCGAGNVVMLRSDKGAELAKNTFMQATVSATKSTTVACTSAAWTIGVKQSNDFSGSGNDFTPTNLVDATPLGSIGLATTNIDSDGGSQYVSLQNSGGLFTLTATAYDTCGNVKDGYDGTSLFSPPTLYTGSFTKVGLDGVTLPALSWSHGTASTSITPLVAQVGNDVTVADTVSGISASTGLFDVVDYVCNPGDACSWKDKETNPSTTVSAQVNGFLGVGFKSAKAVNFTCGTKTAAIGSIVEISPSQVFGDSKYTVSIVYSKQASGSGPAAGFVVCLSKDNGTTWGDLNPEGDNTPLQACSDTVPAPCILAQKRITGGALEVDLSLTPVDPWPGIG